MPFEHYIFGKFIKTKNSPDENFLFDIFKNADNKRTCLYSTDINLIIQVLDNTGRLWRDPDYKGRKTAIKLMPDVTGFHASMVTEVIDAMSLMLERKYLENKVRTSLGSIDISDGYIFNPVHNAYFKAHPLGNLLHISPGNVFAGCIDSLINGLLSKNLNILKMASADPVFPLLFAKSIQEADPEKIISDKFVIISFRGGDKRIEYLLKEKCNGIVVWGSSEVAKYYRSTTPAKCRLIEYGPRISLAIVTDKIKNSLNIEKFANNLVTDIVYWEQRACSSPQLLYIENPDNAFIDKLMLSLKRSFLKILNKFPIPVLTTDEKAEITRERYVSLFDSASSENKILFSKKDSAYTVLYENNPDFRLSPLNRFIIIKPFRALNELMKILKENSFYLQSCSIETEPENILKYSKALNECGITRITGTGKLHAGVPNAPHEGDYELRKLIRFCNLELNLNEMTDTYDPQAHFQKLKFIIDFAKSNSFFYKKLYNKIKFNNLNDIKRFPVITGEDLYNNTPPVSFGMLTDDYKNAISFSSGGTTGKPKFILYSHDEWLDITEQLSKIYRLAGITEDDRVANLFMAGNLWSSFLAVFEALKKINATILPISGNADQDTLINYIQILKPNVLVGLPSVIMKIANEIINGRIKGVRIEKVLYAGESLSIAGYKILKNKLGIKHIKSAGYACVDSGIIGYQCSHTSGRAHHLFSDYMHIDIIDLKTKKIITSPGTEGEIVATNLKRKLLPIIRYRTGDRGIWLDQKCPCQRLDPLFELRGRVGDVIRAGTVSIYPEGIEKYIHTDNRLSNNYQIIAEIKDNRDFMKIVIETLTDIDGVSSKKISEKIKKKILNEYSELNEAVEKKWLGGFEIILAEKDSIPRVKRTGKIIKVIDKRN